MCKGRGILLSAVMLFLCVFASACMPAIVPPTIATGGPTSRPAPVPTEPPRQWTTYTSVNRVEDVTFDRDGYLWAATSGGGARWDPSTGAYTKYTTDDGLARNDVRAVAALPDGRVCFGTRAGISCFDGQTWTTHTTADGLVSASVDAMAVDQSGVLWAGACGGVSRFDGQTWITYTAADGLVDGCVRAIASAPDGSVWFVTHGGIVHFDGQRWTTYTPQNSMISKIPDTLAVDSSGQVWVASQGKLMAFDPVKARTLMLVWRLLRGFLWIVTILALIVAINLAMRLWHQRQEKLGMDRKVTQPKPSPYSVAAQSTEALVEIVRYSTDREELKSAVVELKMRGMVVSPLSITSSSARDDDIPDGIRKQASIRGRRESIKAGNKNRD